MSLPDPRDCPQLTALLCGGPLNGDMVCVPMLENGHVPDHLKLRESHKHGGGSCMTSTLVYHLQPGAHEDVDAIYKWGERDVVVGDLTT